MHIIAPLLCLRVIKSEFFIMETPNNITKGFPFLEFIFFSYRKLSRSKLFGSSGGFVFLMASKLGASFCWNETGIVHLRTNLPEHHHPRICSTFSDSENGVDQPLLLASVVIELLYISTSKCERICATISTFKMLNIKSCILREKKTGSWTISLKIEIYYLWNLYSEQLFYLVSYSGVSWNGSIV